MRAPNFLHNLIINPKQHVMSGFGLLVLFFAGVLFMTLAQAFTGITFLTIGALLLLLFTFKNEWGMYVLAATSFFIGLEVSFAQYDTTRNIPYLASLNAPLVDFLAILLLLSVGLAWFLHVKPFRMEYVLRAFPGFRWYGLFLLSSVISLAFIYDHAIGTGIKYFTRAMLFSYVAFVWLPVIVIREQELLDKFLRIWAWVGIGIALFGISSFFVVSHGVWVRFVPYAFFNIAPLGVNHNLLGEPLVALIPIIGYVASVTKDKRWRLFFWSAGVVMLLVALLTLSRAAWIGLFAQGVFAAYLWREKLRAFIQKAPWLRYAAIAAIIPVVLYMAQFLFFSSIVTSSNTARWEATKVAAFYTVRSPLIGYGPGMYLQLLGETATYRQDFGGPLDSHGFLQKISLEEGMLGLFFFVGFLLWVLHTLWEHAKGRKKYQPLFRVLFLSVLGIMIFQLFNTSYFNSVMWLPIGISLAAVQLHKRKKT